MNNSTNENDQNNEPKAEYYISAYIIENMMSIVIWRIKSR